MYIHFLSVNLRDASVDANFLGTYQSFFKALTQNGCHVAGGDSLPLEEAALMIVPMGGVPDMVRHMQTGLLVSKDSPREFAVSIRQLLVDSQLRRSLGEQGRRHITSLSSPATVLPQMLRVYRDQVFRYAKESDREQDTTREIYVKTQD